MNLQSIIDLISKLFSKTDDNSKGFGIIDNILSLLQSESFSQVISSLDGELLHDFSDKLGFPIETIVNLVTLYAKLKSGELNLKQLLPSFLPIILEYFGNKKSTSEPVSEVDNNYLKLQPIESFTNESIFSSLNDYFDNESAS